MAMAAELSGSQWNEGDVSCSVVRRVMLPDAFYACDGLLETFISVLDSLEVFEDSLAAEIEASLPYLASTRLLTAAIEKGMGREEAHAVLSRYLANNEEISVAGVAAGLGDDNEFPLEAKEIEALIRDVLGLAGAAQAQITAFSAEAKTYLKRFPEAPEYTPAEVI